MGKQLLKNWPILSFSSFSSLLFFQLSIYRFFKGRAFEERKNIISPIIGFQKVSRRKNSFFSSSPTTTITTTQWLFSIGKKPGVHSKRLLRAVFYTFSFTPNSTVFVGSQISHFPTTNGYSFMVEFMKNNCFCCHFVRFHVENLIILVDWKNKAFCYVLCIVHGNFYAVYLQRVQRDDPLLRYKCAHSLIGIIKNYPRVQ